MAKIVIKSESIAAPDLLVKALVILPETAVIAFHVDERMLYIRDEEVDTALTYLSQAGIVAEIVSRAHD